MIVHTPTPAFSLVFWKSHEVLCELPYVFDEPKRDGIDVFALADLANDAMQIELILDDDWVVTARRSGADVSYLGRPCWQIYVNNNTERYGRIAIVYGDALSVAFSLRAIWEAASTFSPDEVN